MGDVYDRKLDAIRGQRVMDAWDLIRFKQGRLHEDIVQKRLLLVQEARFVMWQTHSGKCALAHPHPFYPLPSSAFPHRRIRQMPYLVGVFGEERGCQLFSAQRDEIITLMHDVNR